MPRVTSIRPMLETKDLAATIAFWCTGLGFACIDTWGHDPERPTWCCLARDGASLMFSVAADHTHDDGTVHEAHDPTMTGSIYLNVDDADAMFAALGQGVVPEWGPKSWDHGMRDFGVRDPNGYLVVIGAPIEGS